MVYLRRTPPPPLDRVIDHLWIFADEEVPMSRGRLYADGCTDLMVHLGDPLELRQHDGALSQWSGAWLSGHRTGPSQLALQSRRFTMVGARFRPAALAAVFGAPAAEFADQVVDLRALWPSTHVLMDRVASARGPEERLEVLAATIASRIDFKALPPPALVDVVERIQRAPERATIAALRSELSVSHKHLTRLFQTHVGLSPKAFQRVCRFRRLLDRLAVPGKSPDWAGLALASGYSDQSHLCRDFAAFTGSTPTTRLTAPERLPDYMPVGDTGPE